MCFQEEQGVKEVHVQKIQHHPLGNNGVKLALATLHKVITKSIIKLDCKRLCNKYVFATAQSAC